MMKIYYAHPISDYNTTTEARDVALIETAFGEGVVLNPNSTTHENGYKERRARDGKGMNYFYEEVLPACCACVFRAFPDGKIGAGVAGEIQWFLDNDHPVFEITDRLGLPLNTYAHRVLTVEETKARLQ